MQQNSQTESDTLLMPWDMPLGQLVRYLFVRRWYLWLISIGICTVILYRWDSVEPPPLREYVGSFRIKYADPTLEPRTSNTIKMGDAVWDVKMTDAHTYHPEWTLVNPYNRYTAKKYFESTILIETAGQEMNYTIDYGSRYDDLYPIRPLTLRFTDEHITPFDNWSCLVRVTSEGAYLSGLKGTFRNASVSSSEEVFVPWGKPTETAVGKVIATPYQPLAEDLGTRTIPTELMVYKISSTEAQQRYDANMRRYMTGNVVELFLTANCSYRFVRDFFEAIRSSYERYAKETYAQELERYQTRIREALTLLNSKENTPNSADISAQTRSALRSDLERMLQTSELDALVLKEDGLIEILDNAYVRSPENYTPPIPYLYIILLAFVFSFPLFVVLVELSWKRWRQSHK